MKFSHKLFGPRFGLIISSLITCLLIIGTGNLHAQSFQQGQLNISPGINLGGIGFYGSGSGLPLVASAEFGILDYVGVGPYAGFVTYNYGSGASKYSWRFITFGARGDFHYSTLLEEILETDLSSDNLDLYVALLLGYQTTSYSGPEGTIFGSTFSGRVNSGVAVGGRYYFGNNLAVFVEAGRILYGSLNVGITLKIK